MASVASAPAPGFGGGNNPADDKDISSAVSAKDCGKGDSHDAEGTGVSENYHHRHETDKKIALETAGKTTNSNFTAMPNAFKKPKEGQVIKLGNEEVTMVKELGSGAYAAVWEVILSSSTDPPVTCALKIQCPTDSLAMELEFHVKLYHRVNPSGKPNFYYPFPLAHKLNMYSDKGISKGGLLFMSLEGVGTMHSIYALYARMKTKVPEETVIYFTCRIILHLRTLHINGKLMVRTLRYV